MKPAQIEKLYSKLTPHEQAALILEAAARLDESGVDTILNNVERKVYETVHADYHRRAYGLQWLIGQYGIDYWKNRALLFIASSQAEHGDQQAADMARQFLAKVVALETALAETCKRLKVDMAAVKILAGCPDGDATPSLLSPVDAELVQHYFEIYSHAAK